MSQAGSSITYVDADGFDVGTISAVTGVATTNGGITLTAGSGNLSLSQPLNSGTAETHLQALSGAIVQNSGGAITAGTRA